jgi:acyl carrier protein
MSETKGVPVALEEVKKEKDPIAEAVVKAFGHVLGGVTLVDLDASVFDVYGMDELDRIELVMKVEEDLGIDITDAEEESITTLRKLVEVAKSKKPR